MHSIKSFKRYLTEVSNTLVEMPMSHDVDPDQMMLDDDSISPPGKFDHEEVVGGNNDYTIHGRSWKSQKSPDEKFPIHHFIAVHDKTEIPHIHTRGGTTKDGFFIANETAKHPDSEISAPEFYKEILHSGAVKGIQSGAKQSEGGKSIWKRLARDKEVKVTHHDSETGKEIKLQPHWDSNYDHETPTHFRVQLK